MPASRDREIDDVRFLGLILRLGNWFLDIDIETIGLDPLTDQIPLVQMAVVGLPTLVVDLFQYAPALSQIAPV